MKAGEIAILVAVFGVVGAILIIVYYMMKGFKEITEIPKGFMDWIGNLPKGIEDWIRNVLGGIKLPELPDVPKELEDWMKNVVGGMGGGLDPIRDVFTDIGAGIGGAFATLMDWIKNLTGGTGTTEAIKNLEIPWFTYFDPQRGYVTTWPIYIPYALASPIQIRKIMEASGNSPLAQVERI